jgi:hypothetical protein
MNNQENNKIDFFFSKDTEQIFMFCEKKLDLYEPIWNPKHDEEMTIEHFIRFLEEGLLQNIASYYKKENKKDISLSSLGEHLSSLYVCSGSSFWQIISCV